MHHHHAPPPCTTTMHPHHAPPPCTITITMHHHHAPPPCTTTMHHHHAPPPCTTTTHHHHALPPCTITMHHHHAPPPCTATMHQPPTNPVHPSKQPSYIHSFKHPFSNTPSIPPNTPSTPPNTPSTPPNTPSTPPNTPATPPNTSFHLFKHPYNLPNTPTTFQTPLQPSKHPPPPGVGKDVVAGPQMEHLPYHRPRLLALLGRSRFRDRPPRSRDQTCADLHFPLLCRCVVVAACGVVCSMTTNNNPPSNCYLCWCKKLFPTPPSPTKHPPNNHQPPPNTYKHPPNTHQHPPTPMKNPPTPTKRPPTSTKHPPNTPSEFEFSLQPASVLACASVCVAVRGLSSRQAVPGLLQRLHSATNIDVVSGVVMGGVVVGL